MQPPATEQLFRGQPIARSEPYSFETINSPSGISTYPVTETEPLNQLTRFQSQFTGCMGLYADSKTVAQYLDAHQDWFCRCAHPMKVNPLGDNGYNLTIGRFGAFGYNVEPRIGLELLPQNQEIYRIRTIPVLDQGPQAYQVDFQSALQLVEIPVGAAAETSHSKLTQVEWHLELAVLIQFPKFIHKLPQRLIQPTGDRLLTQIVRQVSQRLTARVQEDFHASLGRSHPF